jgi:hypothetical protein
MTSREKDLIVPTTTSRIDNTNDKNGTPLSTIYSTSPSSSSSSATSNRNNNMVHKISTSPEENAEAAITAAISASEEVGSCKFLKLLSR